MFNEQSLLMTTIMQDMKSHSKLVKKNQMYTVQGILLPPKRSNSVAMSIRVTHNAIDIVLAIGDATMPANYVNRKAGICAKIEDVPAKIEEIYNEL